jgi:tripartite-type tricarboxylate transporter receptor subunit TctC
MNLQHWKKLVSIGAVITVTIANLIAAPAAHAQEYPKKGPIKIVVAVPAGGGTDVTARITAEFLSRRLGQTVIVENKPGASAAIGADYVFKSPADGYTLFLTASELPVLAAVRKNLPYKYDEFTYLVRPFLIPPLLFASPKLPLNSIQDLVTYMKANPGKINIGNTGTGAIVHMGLAMFENGAGVKGTHIPYAGVAPIFQDLFAGHVDITEASTPFPEGIKVLGSVGTKRHPLYPNLPTLDEVGIKNATWDLWYGFVAPPNLPKPIADRLITELTAVFKDPEAIAKYQASVKNTPAQVPLIGDAFKRRVIEEQGNWKSVVEREKIVLE